MRLANQNGRAVLTDGSRAVDIENASNGEFSSDPMAAYAVWNELRSFAASVDWTLAGALEVPALGPCVPRPSAVFGIGLNYRDHAAEAGLDVPSSPMVFTKFPSCIAGPKAEVPLFGDRVDWEAELVVVIGKEADAVDEAEAFDHVAGCCVGQDISDRKAQFKDKPPQFSMGKSRRAYGPIGPWLTSLDEVGDPDDLAITCDVAGERMQQSRTSEMIFPVREIIAFLSSYCVLQPGDLIFTGTPSGVGSVRDPRRYLAVGEAIVTEIEGLGRLENRCIAG